MSDNKFGDNLIKELKDKKITPKSKWHFILRDYFVWISGVLSLLIGGMACSVMIYFLVNDWKAYQRVADSFLSFILLTLPYFWILFLLIFILITYYNIRHTKKGYKFSLSILALGAILASVILGISFYGIGIGQAIDDVLGEKTPFYPKILNRHMGMWSMPDEGRISGKIISEKTGEEFIIMDINKKQWKVLLNKNTKQYFKRNSGFLKVIGKKISDNVFEAHEILPMGPGRGMFKGCREDCRHKGAVKGDIIQ